MYKKAAIFLGALLAAAIGALITAYLFAGRRRGGEYYDEDMMFI